MVLSTEQLLDLIKDRGMKPVMVMTVKQENFSPYKVPYSSIEEFEQDKKLFNLTLIDTEYMLLTDEEERKLLKDGILPY